MQGFWLDYGTALCGAISAFFWVRSARVEFKFGFYMDRQLHDAMTKSSRLNAWAAGFAAAAAGLPALKTFGSFVGVIH